MDHNLKAPDPRTFPTGQPKIVVPVRFTRFRGGPGSPLRSHEIRSGEPPVDDHGWFQSTPLHVICPAVGYFGVPGQTSRFSVQVARDLISQSARLFPVIDDPAVATVVTPPSGGSLPLHVSNLSTDGDRIEIAVTATGAHHSAVLRLHYGAPDGPVVAALILIIYLLIEVPVRVHTVTIHNRLRDGTAPGTTPAEVRALFDRVNAIYEQVGLRFVFSDADAAGNPQLFPIDNTPIRNFFFAANNVSTETEAIQIMTLAPVPATLSVYLIRRFGPPPPTPPGLTNVAGNLGFGLGRRRVLGIRRAIGATATLPQPGIIVRDPRTTAADGITSDDAVFAHAFAHELGHCLELDHYDNGQFDPTVSSVRNDLWAHSNLMHNFALLSRDLPTPLNDDPRFYNSPLRTNTGYGLVSTVVKALAGDMLSIRDHRDRARLVHPEEADEATPPGSPALVSIPGLRSIQPLICREAALRRSFAPF